MLDTYRGSTKNHNTIEIKSPFLPFEGVEDKKGAALHDSMISMIRRAYKF